MTTVDPTSRFTMTQLLAPLTVSDENLAVPATRCRELLGSTRRAD
ncbi:hypothetical protein ACFCWT_25410 [Streptomyces olivaceus]